MIAEGLGVEGLTLVEGNELASGEESQAALIGRFGGCFMNNRDRLMPFGRIKRVIYLSEQTQLPNTRLVPDHNDQGYGVIEAEDGQEVFFLPEAVESRGGFEDIRNQQRVEYSLESAPYLRAKWVKPTEAAFPGIAPWVNRATTN